MLFDTCALLWVTLYPEKITEMEYSIARQALDNQSACVSSISFWEVGLKMKKDKLKLPVTLDEYVRLIQELNGIEIVSVDENIWTRNIQLDWEHRDPADRTIVATATMRNIPILTKDKLILGYYPHQGWPASD